MVLDAFGVGFGEFDRHAERAQEIDHEAVAHPHAVGQRVALLGQEHAAIGPRGGQAGAFQARDGLDRGGVRHAEAPGDIGRAGFALACQEIGDQLGVILQQAVDCADRVLPKRRAWVPSAGSFAICALVMTGARRLPDRGAAILDAAPQRNHNFSTVSKCSLGYI